MDTFCSFVSTTSGKCWKGFDAAPRVVDSGFDEQGRETLTYIEGEIIHPAPWTDDAVVALGTMLRRLHDATESFQIPDNPIWRPWFGRKIGSADMIIGHCDVAPWNVVTRDGLPIALIDWEAAGPVDRLTEVAMAIWAHTQLYDDDLATRNGLADPETRVKQARLMADAYGLAASDRQRLPDRMLDYAAQSAADEAVELGLTPDTHETRGAWAIAWRARSVAWMFRHRDLIEQVLGD